MKIKLLPLGLALALVLLSGCATPLPSITSWDVATVSANTTVTRDEFKKLTSINSPKISFGGDGFVDIYRYELTAERKDGGDVRYFFLLFTQRGYRQSWAFWESAADQNGKEFKFVKEGSDVLNGGIVKELLSTQVTREYLESIKGSGVTWRIYGQRATKETVISPNLVAGFLEKCAATFAAK